MRIAAATVNQTPIDWDNNVGNILHAIHQAKEVQADILLLPELCLCGYGCEDLFLADWVIEKSLEKLLLILPSTKGLAVSIGMPLTYQGALFNCACFVYDTQILGFSAKQYLANDGVHYEHRWFQPWKQKEEGEVVIHGKKYPFGDLVYEIKGAKVAFEICEDMWHQESRPAAFHKERGVSLILNPSCSPFTFGKTKRREQIVVTSTLLYQCAYVYANLLGNEAGKLICDGEIFIASEGKLRKQNKRFSYQNVNLVFHDFNLDKGQLTSQGESYLPDQESKETEFYKAACLGLFDYLRKSRSKCYVLSLSGGADSTCCAVLVKLMVDLAINELGREAFLQKLNRQDLNSQDGTLSSQLLYCAYQATQNSSEVTFQSAKEVAEELGASFYSWKIDEALAEYTNTVEKALQTTLSWHTHDLALQNIQARVRAPYIWLLANLKNGLLITTSNRSEGDVGYCTMDGDTAGGIAPIAGVDKAFVQHWLRWAEKEFKFSSLRHVNSFQPTAELRPLEAGQTDEADLMPYPLLLRIEELAIHQRYSPKRVLQSLDQETFPRMDLKSAVKKFFRLWQQNQWKRERLAPSFYLDEFSVDPKSWCRYPILGSGFEEELNAL
jgi:NAD+ synthase (glutamine-hydrolysing)